MSNSVDHKTQLLVTLAKGGDSSALDRLCRAYGERVRRIVRLRMGSELRSRLESMDVVQDTLMCALRDLGDFAYRDEGDFLRWLSRIVENRLRDNVDKLHADKRDIRKEVRLDNKERTAGNGFVGTAGPIDVTTPSVIVSRKEEMDKLEEAIDTLKPEYREVIVLKRLEGLSYKEIGKRLGKSPDAVGMLLSRAMVSLTGVFESDL
ncbi:MAG: sigma-70 family RNA polymerase sigma factor [Planctomycetota bacterium]